VAEPGDSSSNPRCFSERNNNNKKKDKKKKKKEETVGLKHARESCGRESRRKLD